MRCDHCGQDVEHLDAIAVRTPDGILYYAHRDCYWRSRQRPPVQLSVPAEPIEAAL